jgi:small subunit ribosomal protein S20
MRSAIRAVNDSQDKGEAEGNYVKAQAVIDKLVSKGIIHRNQGAKRKSRLARRVAKFA